jgi:hypothetical protein
MSAGMRSIGMPGWVAIQMIEISHRVAAVADEEQGHHKAGANPPKKARSDAQRGQHAVFSARASSLA